MKHGLVIKPIHNPPSIKSPRNSARAFPDLNVGGEGHRIPPPDIVSNQKQIYYLQGTLNVGI